MNSDHTLISDAEVAVVAYADGVYNLELHRDGDVVKVEITEDDASRLCQGMDERVPNAQRRETARWV